MKTPNYYERIRVNLLKLNSLKRGLFVIRMDGELIQLYDCSRNRTLITKKASDIKLFCHRLYHTLQAITLYCDYHNSKHTDLYRRTLLKNPMNKRYVKLYNELYNYE